MSVPRTGMVPSKERRGSVRRSRWHNFHLLLACRSQGEMTRLILDSLSPHAGVVRVHVSGDFWSQAYFDAWMRVAQARPRTLLYAYTKSLPYWVARLGQIPDNFVLTASKGGQHDELIEAHCLRYAQVVFSEAEASRLGLPIDHDDRHAMKPEGNFALLIHGTQPAGTEAAQATAVLRAQDLQGNPKEQTMIRAETHSDDHKVEVAFDATRWFEQAGDQDIVELGRCGWGGDYPADAVAQFMADLDPAVARLFTYLEFEPTNYGESVGFECHVNEADALSWLREHRPTLHRMLEAEESDTA